MCLEDPQLPKWGLSLSARVSQMEASYLLMKTSDQADVHQRVKLRSLCCERGPGAVVKGPRPPQPSCSCSCSASATAPGSEHAPPPAGQHPALCSATHPRRPSLRVTALIITQLLPPLWRARQLPPTPRRPLTAHVAFPSTCNQAPAVVAAWQVRPLRLHLWPQASGVVCPAGRSTART